MASKLDQRDIPPDLRPGSHVRVRQGLDVLPGSVLESYSSGSGTRVVVRLDGALGEEEATITVPVGDVYPDEGADLEPPGLWIHALPYEKKFHEALYGVFRRLGRRVSSAEALPRQFDYLIQGKDGNAVIEVKFVRGSVLDRRLASIVSDHLAKVSADIRILVTNAELMPDATRWLAEHDIFVMTWQPGGDTEPLYSVLATILSPGQAS